MTARRLVIAATLTTALLGGAAAAWLLRDRTPQAWPIMALGDMTPQDLSHESYRVTPAMLTVIYDAFSRTDEGEIYDTLARVAGGAALEQLYLERVGAMRGGGLEPDQTIHEIALLNLGARVRDGGVAIAATWRVLGTVGHAEHLHVRGNAYTADFLMTPQDGAWRLTGFSLRDVDRTGAGDIQEQQDNPYFDAPETPDLTTAAESN